MFASENERASLARCRACLPSANDVTVTTCTLKRWDIAGSEASEFHVQKPREPTLFSSATASPDSLLRPLPSHNKCQVALLAWACMQYFFSFGFRCACSGRRESAGGLGDQTRSRHPSQANDWLLMRCVGHSRSIDSRSATGRPGSESYAPSQGLAVATRATEKELNKYPGKKNIVLVYRTITYVYDIRAVELIECPRRRNWVPSGSPLPPRLAMPSRSFPCARDELSAGQPQCR